MRKLAYALIGIAGIVASACGGAAVAPALPEVRVSMSEFKFSPNTIQIPAGTKVEFKFTNSGVVEHDLIAEGIGFHVMVPASKRLSLESGPFAPGEYDTYCSVPGHREAGMVGKIVVK